MNDNVKTILYGHPLLVRGCLKIVNILSFNNISTGTGNEILNSGWLKKCKIKINGTGNRIIIDDYSRIIGSSISITGNNNTIHIGKKVFLEYGELCIEDDNGEIAIGDCTIISQKNHIAAIEGTKIIIGRDCLFSSEVTIRSGDSHTIFDIANKKRINFSQDVIIGNHVWLGNKSTVLKGCRVSDDCVVGTNSVLTKSIPTGCVVAGNPAKIIRENIGWSAFRYR